MVLPDDTLEIDTPENVIFQYKVAGIGSRFLAALVDSLLIVTLQILGTAAFYGIIRLFSVDLSLLDLFSSWVLAAAGLILFVFFWGFYIFFESVWNGQTPGKRLFKLRVIRSDGSPISFSEALIRNLVRIIDFMPIYYGIGVVVMFLNDQSRRLGDMAAGTLVVHDRGAITLESLEKSTIQPRPDLAPQGLPELAVDRLSAADIQAAEEFINRRSDLYNRQAMALRISEKLAVRMNEPVPGEATAEEFILRVVRAARLRHP